MKRFPINRVCPLSGNKHSRVLAYLPAISFCAVNPTYRTNFPEILSISTDDEFPIVESPSGFVFSGWCPSDDFLKKVYEEVIDHSQTITETVAYRQGLLEFGAAFLRVVTNSHISTSKPMRLLDFGCGYGTLARMLAGRDIRCYGYEPSRERLAIASQRGFEVLDSLDKVADVGPFDLIICTEVLEHVVDPRGVLRFLRNHASPGALVALTVPQCETSFVESSLASLPENADLSRIINPWEHLNYFSAESLRALLIEGGFKLVSDYGRTRRAYDACLQIGEQMSFRTRARAGLKVLRSLMVRSQSTELICQVPR